MTLTINSTKKLNNGIEMPLIGLGVYQSQEGREVEQAILWALQAATGISIPPRFIATRRGVGRAIKESGLSREEIFVTTKLWNDDQGYDTALRAIDGSLERLGMEYVDLYLIHCPTPVRLSAATSAPTRGARWRRSIKPAKQSYRRLQLHYSAS